MNICSKLNSWFFTLQKFIFKKFLNTTNSINSISAHFDEEQNNNLLLEELDLVQNQLAQAHVVFNSQTNVDLIESSIYYIDSLETKYNYLIKEARKRQLKCVLKSI